MSRIGRQPIEIPQGVEVSIEGSEVKVTGPKGVLSLKLFDGIDVKKEENEIVVSARRKDKPTHMMHGTTRALLANMVKGCSDGWSKTLELVGTGYRAEVQGKDLVLTVGYSQPVRVTGPEGIAFAVEKTDVTISGIDRELVGRIAAKVRDVRPPEPYQGKGIKYKDEVIRRKAGKAAKTAEGA